MAGRLLVLGSVLFIVGAANPALGAVWSAPLDTQLRLIHDATTAWTATNVLFLVGTVITATGLWFVPESIGDGGATPARAAAIVYLVAATSWLASLAFRLTVTPHAASTLVAGGSMDPTYVILNLWAVGLFGVFTYLAGCSLIALGVAAILGRAVSAVAAWFAIVIGVVIVVGYTIVGDMPPFVAFLPTGLLGVVLMRRRETPAPSVAGQEPSATQLRPAH